MRIASGLLAVSIVAFGSSAFAQKRVVLYTAHETSFVQSIAPVFEKETGIKITVVELGSSDLTSRARAEAKTPRPT